MRSLHKSSSAKSLEMAEVYRLTIFGVESAQSTIALRASFVWSLSRTGEDGEGRALPGPNWLCQPHSACREASSPLMHALVPA